MSPENISKNSKVGVEISLLMELFAYLIFLKKLVPVNIPDTLGRMQSKIIHL